MAKRPGIFSIVMAVLSGAIVLLGGYYLIADDEGEPRELSLRDLVANSDPGPIHVHGLGINPADRSLFIATHTGMYRARRGQQEAKRVTNRYQDTQGFTIVGPNRFLGSGHPDINEARERDCQRCSD